MKRLLTTLAASLAVTLSLSVADAGVVHLKDGRVLKGDVTESKDSLRIQGKYGAITVLKKNVVKWEESSAEEDAFAAKAKQLAGGSADERYRLGVFARDKGLDDEAKKAFQSVLDVNPNHAGARAALGFVQHNGVWMTRADKYRLEGKVKFKGRWVSLDEKAEMLRKAAEERRLKKEKKERREAERRARRRLNAPDRQDSGRAIDYGPQASNDRYRLLRDYYGPYPTIQPNGFGVFLGPYALPLYRALPIGRALTYQEQLIAAAALRRGQSLPAHLLNPYAVVQSPGFRYTPGELLQFGRLRRGGGTRVGVSFGSSSGNTRFRAGFSTRQSRSRSFSGPFRRSFSGRSSSFAPRFSGSYRSGRSSFRFRFNP